jgi:MFS family permease
VRYVGKNKPAQNFLPWLISLSAGLFFLYEFFQLNVFDVINQDLTTAFNINAAELSFMSSMFVWANVIFLLPAGIILDKFSVKKVIVIAMGICILGTLGFALTNSYKAACFYHGLTGIGNAFCFLSCVVLIARWFPAHKQAFVIACVVTMAFVGGMLAHTPVVYLNQNLGWRNTIIIDAILGVVFLLWIIFTVHDNKHQDENVHKNDSDWLKLFLKALLNPINFWAGIYTACLNLPIMVLCALWGVKYFTTVHNVTSLQASSLVSMIFLGSIFGCPLAGRISDNLKQRKPVMWAGGILSLLSVLCLWLQLSMPLLVLVCFSLGFFTSTQVISYPLISESNHPKVTGLATSIASLIIMSGGGLAQILFGCLVNNTADFSYAMLLFPAAIILALVVNIFIKESNCENVY